MQEGLRVGKVLALVLIGLILLLRLSQSDSLGKQEAAPEEKKQAVQKKYYRGVQACSFCHDGARPNQSPILCRCDEVSTWELHDKHADAWTVLLSPRAQQMGRLMGYKDVELDVYEQSNDGGKRAENKTKKQVNAVAVQRECVACHGVRVDDPRYVTDYPALLKDQPTFRKEEGVSCYVCHGKEDNIKWVREHFNPDEGTENTTWRGIKGKDGLTSREIKERDFGMRDLWDPIKRSKLCLSCHLGNTEEGKFVTHAMYAAGHPPLSSMEIATFSEEMPRHWQYPFEKPDAVKKLQDFDADQAQFERTQLVLLGGTAALRESLNLVATQAEKLAQAEKPDDQMLDLALFDCYACHHELKESGWRARRGYRGGKPGRPHLQAWPTSLVRSSLRSLGREPDELDQATDALFKVFDARPFGDPKKAAAEGRKAVEWTNKVLDQLKNHKLNSTRAKQVLDIMSTLKDEDYPDYDSANQLARGFLAIHGDTRQLAFPQVKEASKQLDELMMLWLPKRGKEYLEPHLAGRLKKRAAYDPDVFKREFKKMTTEMLK